MRRFVTVGLLFVALGCSGDSSSEEPATGTSSTLDARAASTPVAPSPAIPAHPAAPAPPAPAVDPAELAVVRSYTQMFYRGELDLLHEKFSEEMREVLPLDKLSTMYEQVITNYGKETQVIGEDSQRNETARAFVRWARFDKTEEVIEVMWILRDSSDEIAGFYVRPAKRKVRAESR